MLVDNLWNSYIFVVPVYDSDGQIVSVINRLQRLTILKTRDMTKNTENWQLWVWDKIIWCSVLIFWLTKTPF